MNDSANGLPQDDPENHRCPKGSYPAMVTPFREDGTIDFDGVDRLTDWHVEAGVAGIFACGLSAEINWMQDAEKIALADRIVQRVAGRIPVVATAIRQGTIDDQAQLVCRMHDIGAEVVAISVCQLAEESEEDRVWIKRFNALVQQVPASIPLAFYECPLPYWRLLSDQTIDHVAQTGRFCFLKDTCCDIDTIRRRLDIIRDTRLQLFNANTPTLLASLGAGADGFCGIGANYFPELYAWICRHFADQSELASNLHQFLDSTFRLTEGEFYPVSAKWYVRERGVEIGLASRKLPDATLPAKLIEDLNTIRTSEIEWMERVRG
ncbi:MAG: dihydrodipicolinate synthase family protein [Pirellulales bacterium]